MDKDMDTSTPNGKMTIKPNTLHKHNRTIKVKVTDLYPNKLKSLSEGPPGERIFGKQDENNNQTDLVEDDTDSNARTPRHATEDQQAEIRQLQYQDSLRVKAAIEAAGGLGEAKHFDPAKTPPKRKGADTLVKNEAVQIDDLDVPAPKAARPQEKDLRRLTAEELCPAPMIMPSGACRLDMIRPAGMVKEQNIQLLTLLRSHDKPEAPWTWPKDDILQTMFDDVVDLFEDNDIIVVALGARVDPDNGITTVTLSTINQGLFYSVIDAIQDYTGVKGHSFVVYSKFKYVNRNTATIYFPKRFKRFGHRCLMHMLFSRYPDLTSNYTLLLEQTFTEDLPGRKPRIGDQILVLGGEFLEEIAKRKESETYEINTHWRITIRGGNRCLLYTSPSPRDRQKSRMPSSA